MNIVVTGSLAFDQIMIFPDSFADHIMPDKIHVMSVSFLVDHLHKNYGGVAGNICYNLGLLGNNPVCLASAGKDAEDYKVFLEKNGVRVEHMYIDHEDYTGSFVVITDKKDCQIAGFYPGAMTNDEDLKVADTLEEGENFLVIAPTTPKAMEQNVDYAVKHKLRYLYSPAQQLPRLSKETLVKGVEQAEIVVGNDYEVALIQQKTGMSTESLLENDTVLVTTLGDRGSQIEKAGHKEIKIGVAGTKEIKDPTGSGDAYIAGFLSAYLNEMSLIECGQWGATAAVYAIEQYGTTGHSFSRALFQNRLEENFG